MTIEAVVIGGTVLFAVLLIAVLSTGRPSWPGGSLMVVPVPPADNGAGSGAAAVILLVLLFVVVFVIAYYG